jgi:hypothetical protein
MNIDDRVMHKKYGLGVIEKLYPKYHAARVRYDDGKISTNAVSKLKLVAKDVDEPIAAPVPTQPSRVTRSRSAGSSAVDYALLDRAQAHIAAMYPEADHVVPRLYNGQAYCEVWKDKAANIVFYEERA